jgi:hypothetical protein
LANADCPRGDGQRLRLQKVIPHPTIWRPFAVTAVAATVSLQFGCASPGLSTTQSVRLETPDCDGAVCELSNDKGHWTVATTPGTASITTSSQPLEIACHAPNMGSHSVPARAPSAIDERGMTGAVSGGVVGAGAGAAVVAPLAALLTPAAPLVVMFVVAGAGAGAGAGTVLDEGSRYLRYPETIAVPLVCQSVVPLPSELARAPVGIAVRGLTKEEAAAAGFTGRGAVIVTQMAPGGRAALAGLREHDFIVRCNDAEIHNAVQLQSIVRTLGPDQSLQILVVRDGQSVEITLPPKGVGR